jgi:hypothetical protein
MVYERHLLNVRQNLHTLRESGELDGEGADRSENLHRLFMYPAMMVPAAQHAIIKAIVGCMPNDAWALDPFMGSGTSLMSCLEFGFNVYGQDINPFAVMLSRAKVERYDMLQLKSVCQTVLETIMSDDCDKIDVSFTNIDKWFNHDVQISLSKIRRAIQSVEQTSIRFFLWVIMSEVIRTGSNDRTSTFKLHRRKEEDIQNRKVDIIKEFYILVNRGIDDIEHYWSKVEKESGELITKHKIISDIRWGDTKESVLSKTKFDLLVSSPPYGDNHTTVTYGQTSYLPLQWIDPIDLDCPYDYVKTTQEIDRQSLGGKTNSKEAYCKAKELFAKSLSFKNFYETIPDEEKKKYNKTIIFIADFAESLNKIVNSMKPDAFYIWTIGNRFVGGREVPNDKILIDLMTSEGIDLFERAERHILNKKQARINNYSKTMEKEHILIFHKSSLL